MFSTNETQDNGIHEMIPTIMVHVPKTGGTSIWRCVERLGIPYQNLGYSLRPKCNPAIPFTNMEHLLISRLIEKKVFTQEWYDARFKFSFVRNPWDRLVSLFEYLQYRLNQKRERESNQYLHSFESFARKVVEKDCSFVRPLGKLTTDDWSQANPQMRWVEQGVNFIGRFERLEADWNLLCKIAGIPYKPLPVFRKSRKRLPHYRDYYTRELWDSVGEFYYEDVERFDYKETF